MIVAAIVMVACAKQEDLPTPLVIEPITLVNETEVIITPDTNVTVIPDTISTKIVLMDVEQHHSFSSSSYSSNGSYLGSYDHGQWYEFELKEGEFLSVQSNSPIGLGSPIIKVWVDNVLVHTEYAAAANGIVSYTYTNN